MRAGAAADDFYHRFDRDIAVMQQLGARSFRLSISWTRVFPQADGVVNQAGLDFYSRVVDALLAASIEPHVTLYHWDCPQVLLDLCILHTSRRFHRQCSCLLACRARCTQALAAPTAAAALSMPE